MKGMKTTDLSRSTICFVNSWKVSFMTGSHDRSRDYKIFLSEFTEVENPLCLTKQWLLSFNLVSSGQSKCWFQMIILCGDFSGVFFFLWPESLSLKKYQFLIPEWINGRADSKRLMFSWSFTKKSVCFFVSFFSPIYQCFKMWKFKILG